MKFKYRKISEERCKEIDSWEIGDPYGYGIVFTADRKKFIANEDESILFCCAFLPTHDDYDRYYSTYLLIKEQEYYFVRYDFESIIDDKSGLIPVRNENIVILEEKYIEESTNKKEILEVIKTVISKYEENGCCLKIAREREYRFKFTYKGEEVLSVLKDVFYESVRHSEGKHNEN